MCHETTLRSQGSLHLGSSIPEAFLERLLHVEEREPAAVDPFMLQALGKLGAFTHLSLHACDSKITVENMGLKRSSLCPSGHSRPVLSSLIRICVALKHWKCGQSKPKCALSVKCTLDFKDEYKRNVNHFLNNFYMNQTLKLPCIFGQIQLHRMSLNYFQLFLFIVTARKFKMTYGSCFRFTLCICWTVL